MWAPGPGAENTGVNKAFPSRGPAHSGQRRHGCNKAWFLVPTPGAGVGG